MGYQIEKHHVERINVETVKLNFMAFKQFSITRKDLTACGLCDTPFQGEDNTNLAFVQNEKNRIICDGCAEKALANGAELSKWV